MKEIQFVCSTRGHKNSKLDFSELRQNYSNSCKSQNNVSLKSPNLPGYWLTPPELGEISFEVVTLHPTHGVFRKSLSKPNLHQNDQFFEEFSFFTELGSNVLPVTDDFGAKYAAPAGYFESLIQ